MTKESIEKLLAFVREHADEDPLKLVFSQHIHPDVDVKLAAQQLEGRRQALVKWPTLSACDNYIYPPKLNREQSSSEETATFKRLLLNERTNTTDRSFAIADLTGGMGIDSVAFAKDNKKYFIDYIEQNPELCCLMEHNIDALRMDNIGVHCADSLEWLAKCGKHFDIIYIDPARRDSHGRKVAAFSDCTPNIIDNINLVRSHCDLLMVKASPMMDIDSGISELREVSAVHIVAVKGECKELLFLCEPHKGETEIHCHNISKNRHYHTSFTRKQENEAEANYCTKVSGFLYEPDASLMKGGPFKLLCSLWGLQKLARNTQLYTSNQYKKDFPGRVLQIISETALNRKAVNASIPGGRAHVVTRNYPSEAATLQKQLGLKEGGELFVVAATVGESKKGFICCEAK